MKKVMTNEYWDRLHQWLKTLQTDFYQPLGELSFSDAEADRNGMFCNKPARRIFFFVSCKKSPTIAFL